MWLCVLWLPDYLIAIYTPPEKSSIFYQRVGPLTRHCRILTLTIFKTSQKKMHVVASIKEFFNINAKHIIPPYWAFNSYPCRAPYKTELKERLSTRTVGRMDSQDDDVLREYFLKERNWIHTEIQNFLFVVLSHFVNFEERFKVEREIIANKISKKFPLLIKSLCQIHGLYGYPASTKSEYSPDDEGNAWLF